MFYVSESGKRIKQCVAIKKGGPLMVLTAPHPEPGAREICIRNRAVALNPVDWKRVHHSILAERWPKVLGIDMAGIVEAVGQDVTELKPGDAVMSFAGLAGRGAAFQEVATVPAHFACKKPEDWTFEEAASVPVLLLGGSSGVGSATLQLLRIALPDAVVITTNAPRHNARLGAAGVAACVDHHGKTMRELVAAVRGACVDLGLDGGGVDAIVDVVGNGNGGLGAGRDERMELFSLLRENGPRVYAAVATTERDMGAVPAGVKAVRVYGGMAFQAGGREVMARLQGLVERGEFRLPVEVEVIGEGLETVAEGLERLGRGGMSGTKLAVRL
ncbi:putative alcohol dehydrogenase [Canariomyces notabilis]|uniref:Alcohol dehydrogenase n=1 Tax=Canariomyces notabilis TaxID=2074819 RepID=A0AAN6QI81_9PEZI|nr:putative alcohol dehydrogenase [Canariomyces arenarius]